MRKTLTVVFAFALALGLMAGPALADDYEYNSTNELNQNEETPGREGQPAPHVNFIEAGIGEVTLEFVMPHSYLACFEYRRDGDTSEAFADEHPNPDLDDDLYPYHCLNDETLTETFEVDEYIEVRLAFGAERDWDFDWTRFDAAPAPPASYGEIRRDARASTVEDIRVSGEYWVVEHEIDALDIDRIWWHEDGTFSDVTQPQEGHPPVSDLWINERDAGSITVFYKLDDGEWLYLAPRFSGSGDLIQVNGVRP